MFGHRVLGLPDIDGDGAADLVVGAPGCATRRDGSVLAFSSRSGKVLWLARGGFPGEWGLGWSMCLLGDVDGDSIPEVAASCSLPRDEFGSGRELRILSGRTGRLVRALQQEESEGKDHFANVLSAVGDVDGDGAEDLAVNGVVPKPGGHLVNGVLVYSGRTGAVLRRVNGGERVQKLYAVSLCATGDWDGRGRPDIAAGLGDTPGDVGAVLVFAGEDGGILQHSQADGRHTFFGGALLPELDVSGRPGLRLLVASAAFDDGSGDEPPMLFRVSSVSSEIMPVGRLPVSRHFPAGAPVWLRGPGATVTLIVAGTDFFHVPVDPERRVYALDPRDASPRWFAECPAPDGEEFGAALAALPDLDGDRIEDVVVGAPGHRPDGRKGSLPRGRVYILSGRTGSLLNALGPGGFEPVPRDDLTRLLPDVHSQDASVRDSALRSARELRLPDVSPLISILEKEDEEHVLAADALLRCVGRHAGPAVQAIRARLALLLAARKDARNQSRNDHVIGSLASTLASDELRAWISDADLIDVVQSLPTISQQLPLVTALAKRAVPVTSVVPWLRQYLDDPDATTREAAWMGLEQFPPSDGEVGGEVRRRALAALVSDPESSVRQHASALLHVWTLDASLGRDPVMALLRERPPRDAATETLRERWDTKDFSLVLQLAGSLRGDLDPVSEALMELSRSPDPILRARAAMALAAVEFDEWRHVEKVIGRIAVMRTDDPDPMVRDAAESAGRIIDTRGEAK